jgi:DNA-binding MarR family transcriptional regulator
MENESSLSNAIVHRLLSLLRYQHRSSAFIQQQVQIPGRQVAVLRFLEENGPSTVTEVSQYLYVREATASTMLDRMEQSGFVTRTRSTEDCRKVIIQPTSLGLELVSKAPLGMISQLRKRLPLLSLEELQRIESSLLQLERLAEVDESLLD